MDPIAKALLNSLRCPLCSGQLDLRASWLSPSKVKDYNFFCVNDFSHYGIFLVHWEHPIRIEQEGVIVNEYPHSFKISQWGNKTEVIVYEIDLEHRVLDNVKPTEFKYEKKLFDFSRTNKEKILNRVKTILVFQ